VRHQRDEVGAQRRQAPELVRSRPLRFVGADVLDCGRDDPTEQRYEFDLLREECIRLRAHEPEHPDRSGTNLQGRDEPTLQAERKEIFLFRIAIRLHRRPVDELAFEHFLQHRPPYRPRGAGREDRVGPPSRDGHHLGAAAFDQDDRDAVEVDQPTELPDEGAERLVDFQRRAEGSRTSVRRLEQVHATAELVPKRLGLAGSRLGDRRFVPQTADEPAHDQAGNEEDAERKGHSVPHEARTAEMVRAPPLRQDEKREQRNRDTCCAEEAVAERALDDDEDQSPPRGTPVFV